MNHHDIQLIQFGHKQGYEKAVREIVAWLWSHGSTALDEAADLIEAEFGGDNEQRNED